MNERLDIHLFNNLQPFHRTSLLSHLLTLRIVWYIKDSILFFVSGSVPDSLYTNWKAGEPNPYDKSCAVMEKSGFYRDIDCKRKTKFMCYKRNNGIIIDPKCQTYDTGE